MEKEKIKENAKKGKENEVTDTDAKIEKAI